MAVAYPGDSSNTADDVIEVYERERAAADHRILSERDLELGFGMEPYNDEEDDEGAEDAHEDEERIPSGTVGRGRAGTGRSTLGRRRAGTGYGTIGASEEGEDEENGGVLGRIKGWWDDKKGSK